MHRSGHPVSNNPYGLCGRKVSKLVFYAQSTSRLYQGCGLQATLNLKLNDCSNTTSRIQLCYLCAEKYAVWLSFNMEFQQQKRRRVVFLSTLREPQRLTRGACAAQDQTSNEAAVCDTETSE